MKSHKPFQNYQARPGRFSQKGWLGLVTRQVTLKGLVGFYFLFYTLIFIYFFKYETIVSRNGLSLGYSERETSSVQSQSSFRMSKLQY